MPATTSEYRQDPITGEWVIVAPGRQSRPGGWRTGDNADRASRDAGSCPFCPGNEHALEEIVQEWKSDEPPGWTQRAVVNLYPAVGNDNGGCAAPGARPGRGRHEVLIESPRHDADIAGLSLPELAQVLAAYQQRLRRLEELEGIGFVSLFRNRGAAAGASLRHPHAQLVALDMIPPRMGLLDERLAGLFTQTGECALCSLIASEEKDGSRLVAADRAFVALVPFAPQAAGEQLILPRRHRASFADLPGDELHELAAALRGALRRLDAVREDPPYNLVFESAPPAFRAGPHWHWHLRLAPRLAKPGGFERSTGTSIVAALPEDDARQMRQALPSRNGAQP